MKKTTIVLALLTVGLTFATVWSWKKLKFSPLKSTSLRLSLDDKVESLDPAKAYSDDSLLLSSQVLEPLYQYHYLKRPYEIQPLLAEGLPNITEKGKLVTIKIRKNVFYHDHPAFKNTKRAITAEDFVTQFKRLALDSLKSPGKSLFTGLIPGFAEYNNAIQGDWKKILATPLEGITAKDENTLVIQLSRSEPNITYYLALNFLSPVPWELVEFQKNNLDTSLVGSGPYFLKEIALNHIDLKKYEDYREDFYPTSGDRYANVQKLLSSSKERIPFIDNVRFYVTGNEEERWEMFFNKELDILTVPKIFIPKLYDKTGDIHSNIRNNGIELKQFPTLANRWLAFNMKDPLLGKNEYLRRAIAYSIDYEKYIEVMSENTNLRANSILVPGIAGYQPAKDFRFKYDLALAKEYLSLAGFKKPEDMPTIIYSTRGNQGISLIEANFIKTHLERIGLKVETQILSFSDFLKKGRANELMFFTDNWLFDYPEGENILQLLISSNAPGINKAGYSNAQIDELYNKLKNTTNIEQRERIFHDMEEIVLHDLPWIPMMYESSFVLQYSNIKNFRKSSIIRNYVKYIKIE